MLFMKKVAIITARGGSKRIPGKNIKDFLGKPIIAYSIDAALSCGLFDEVMVSTDSEAIAAVAKQYGASVPFMRSEKTSDDFSTTVDVLFEVIDTYKEHGVTFEKACCIYPTAPFVDGATLSKAYQHFIDNNFDSVFPVIRFDSPIQRALKVGADHRISMFYPEHQRTRSQDLEPAFHDPGQFYWFRVDRLYVNKKLWAPNSGIIEISPMQGQDIDNPEDWKLAELKYSLINNLKNQED